MTPSVLNFFFFFFLVTLFSAFEFGLKIGIIFSKTIFLVLCFLMKFHLLEPETVYIAVLNTVIADRQLNFASKLLK